MPKYHSCSLAGPAAVPVIDTAKQCWALRAAHSANYTALVLAKNLGGSKRQPLVRHTVCSVLNAEHQTCNSLARMHLTFGILVSDTVGWQPYSHGVATV